MDAKKARFRQCSVLHVRVAISMIPKLLVLLYTILQKGLMLSQSGLQLLQFFFELGMMGGVKGRQK
jgi:hypothetical protein